MNSKDEILKRGYVDVKIYVTGFRQSHRLNIVIEKTPTGEIPFLVSKNYIPNSELVRIANELKLPVKHKDTVVFPAGMGPKDFRKKEESMAKVEPEVVEAEIE